MLVFGHARSKVNQHGRNTGDTQIRSTRARPSPADEGLDRDAALEALLVSLMGGVASGQAWPWERDWAA
ncbi:MAG TPA: hypothetical protein VKP30_21145 [Polyangiaceae bacterium]|nr:hypothetical protein [Polyangiaceae bacterium]